MYQLFLASSFEDIAPLLPQYFTKPLYRKRITFIPTASIPEEVDFFVAAGKKALSDLGLLVDELELSTASATEIEKKITENDFIYISGGNTFYLLQELKRTGADKIICEQIQAGKLYIGESAGAVILSPNIQYAEKMDDVTKAPVLNQYDALHILNFYPLPHLQSFPFVEVVAEIMEEFKEKIELRPFSNTQGLWVDGDTVTVINK